MRGFLRSACVLSILTIALVSCKGIKNPLTPESAPPPPSNTQLIDDLEDNNGQIAVHQGRDGWWYNFHDDTASGVQYPILFAPAAPGDGSAYAAHTNGRGFNNWGSGMGFALVEGLNAVYDAQARGYTGIQFRARVGNGSSIDVRLKAKTLEFVPASDGGACPLSCHDYYGAALTLTTSWQTYNVYFTQMTQQGWGYSAAFNGNHLLGFEWQFGPSVDFDLFLDNLQFITGNPGDTPTATPTPSGTWVPPTHTPTWTFTDTRTPTHTFTATETDTPTDTPEPTATATPTSTRTATATPSPTRTSTWSPTMTRTATVTATYTWSPTGTPPATYTPTSTYTRTSTATFTWTSTWTPTSTFTGTPTNTFTVTNTWTPIPPCTPSAWFGNTGTAASLTLTGGANGVHCSQYAVTTGGKTFEAALMRVYFVTASGYARTGIYSNYKGRPASLLTASPSRTVTAGWCTFDIEDVTLASPATLWLAVQLSSNTAAIRGIAGAVSMSYHSPVSYTLGLPKVIESGGVSNINGNIAAGYCP